MAHRHKLKFIRRGYEFIGIDGWPYRETWDFNCKYCPHTYRADRNVMILLMTGKRK